MASHASGDVVTVAEERPGPAGKAVPTTAPVRRKWLTVLVVLAAVLAVGGGLWYAHARGWLDAAYRWAGQLSGRKDAGPSGGMDRGSMPMGGEGEVSPGRAAVTIPFAIQQKIGVTVGRVERAPLKMSVRTVGIVRPDEELLE